MNRAMARTITVAIFIILYSLITFYMVSRMQHDCPTAKDIALELNYLQKEIFDKTRLKENQNLITINDKNQIKQTLNKSQNDHESKKEPEYLDELRQVNELLNRDFIPRTAFYIWCGKRWFEFPHFLSVKSLMKNLRPDNIVFFYNVYPVVDEWLYNTWFKELTEKYPFFRPHQLNSEDEACNSFGAPNPNFIHNVLTNNGGIYLSDTAIVTNLPADVRSYDVVDAMNWESGHGFIMAKRGIMKNYDLLNHKSSSENLKQKNLECIHSKNYNAQNRKRITCIYETFNFFPKNIWELDTSYGRLVRSIFYESPTIKRPKPSNNTLVPNIAHVVWLGGGEMDFLFLLCILSLLNVAKVENVYLHGDGPPRGPYWDLVKNNERLHLIYRQSPGTVFGTSVKVLSHVTDIWRVDFMIKYGGIYVDTDVVFVKPLDERIRSYDAVATYDWTYWNHPFPDTINFGVSIGKRNAKYWQLFQDTMKWFIDNDWSWNGLRQPYKVLEKHPDLALIDPHLSVICFKSLCHPTWVPDYHNESVHHLNSNSIKNWKEDVYAFHWTLPTPYELLNPSNLLSSNTMFAEIGVYVLEQSNLLEYFKKEVAKIKDHVTTFENQQ